MFEIGSVVKGYTIEAVLGKGKMAKSFLASDSKGKKVVLKTLQLKGLPEWKILELFEREAKILKNLNHPKIPEYIDYFTEEQEDDIIYFLIYEYIEGKSLTKLIEEGRKFDIDIVKNILIQLLEILKYLHNLIPPVIHRDINPNNIIMKEDAIIHLVDFGAVRSFESETMGKGTTFIGTYGYIPLEQMTGDAAPQSDLYAIGMTTIKLLTGKNPGELPMKDLRPQYKQQYKSFGSLERIIDIMIEPDVNKRLITATRLLEYLKNAPQNEKDYYQQKIKNRTIASNIDNHSYKSSSELKVGDSYYEDLGRIKVQTIEDSITLIITSESGLQKKNVNPLVKDSIGFLLANSWVLIILGLFLIGRFSLPWFFYPLLFMFFFPSGKRYLQRKYSLYEDVRIKIDRDKISVPKQLEPIKLKNIKDVYIKRSYTKAGKINLKVVLVYGGRREKHFYISNLSPDEAELVSNFIIRNIETRKKLLLH